MVERPAWDYDVRLGIMRRYERDANGAEWHDGLLMDLLADELDQPR